ncbi:peptidase families S8 and S53 domain protein [Coleofasciculus chthonoplastes PCC 7420]|uniref:Peptidase families S8 and S53 domain protein n=1 Tax=Coleofasciculus chthonoplastes PCC 7420 TaxID=118168 RepID=B4VNK2_9CYAN|nr:S8 family serine peptidase [Coleofasciculus chthonoplastes]EDX76336.1 peptidase families S8 and S53 domain protein [Coleofasciculus chthonoplastes PCC 7420]
MNKENPLYKQESGIYWGMPGDEMVEPTDLLMPSEQMNLSEDDQSYSFEQKQKNTGNLLVLFDEDESATEEGIKALNDYGFKVSTATNYSLESHSNEHAYISKKLGVAVIKGNEPDLRTRVHSIQSENRNLILTIEDERCVYSDAVGVAQSEIEVQLSTWGLKQTKVTESKYSGRGIRVAILDTGFDVRHPDFTNREIIKKSFVSDEDAHDRHGHGTHCTGTACGSRNPIHASERYGIAYDADIYIGKVMNAKGEGTDGWTLAGINWAIENGCHIISMSLGAFVKQGDGYSQCFEKVAERALKQGTLIIAAAGNNSHRDKGIFNAVNHPANCPSIMAVGAINSYRKMGLFSNRGINKEGGEINIVGPGVGIYSSWLLPTKYRELNGTSMATPHVAGIAALFAEANPDARGKALWNLLVNNTQHLPDLNQADVGAGLVQAPLT